MWFALFFCSSHNALLHLIEDLLFVFFLSHWKNFLIILYELTIFVRFVLLPSYPGFFSLRRFDFLWFSLIIFSFSFENRLRIGWRLYYIRAESWFAHIFLIKKIFQRVFLSWIYIFYYESIIENSSFKKKSWLMILLTFWFLRMT